VIDNGLKYGPADSSIDVAVARTGNDAVLTITDEGPGITPEHRARIFRPFLPCRRRSIARDGGTGPRDQTFKDAGKVGLWTKADSVIAFDDLSIVPR
jgi:light-regulated signal transduction histidine kinase (bacteriophytochrome)